MLAERVRRFLAGEADDFESLALAAFVYQFERIPVYRSLCERREATPERVRRWEEVPLVPTLAFRTVKLATDPEQEVFLRLLQYLRDIAACGQGCFLH